jgi:hypothetical protein
MPMRSFSLNDPEAHGALCPPRDGWGPRLSRNPRWRERSDPVLVRAENEVDAEDALKSWLKHACGER